MRSMPASRARFSAIRACVTSSGVTALSRNSVRTDDSAARIDGTSVRSPTTSVTPAGNATFPRCANEGVDVGAGAGQALDDEGTDGAGGTGDENAHVNLLEW